MPWRVANTVKCGVHSCCKFKTLSYTGIREEWCGWIRRCVWEGWASGRRPVGPAPRQHSSPAERSPPAPPPAHPPRCQPTDTRKYRSLYGSVTHVVVYRDTNQVKEYHLFQCRQRIPHHANVVEEYHLTCTYINVVIEYHLMSMSSKNTTSYQCQCQCQYSQCRQRIPPHINVV